MKTDRIERPPFDPIFLDTSIQIARRAHRPEIQESISRRLQQFSLIVSGLVVRQEFKRRLLKDAVYLLKQLEERKSYEKVRRHLLDSLPKAQQRKMRIGLQLLMTVDETDTDDDRYDRARLMLRDLVKNGIVTAEAQLSSLNTATGCACSQQPIIEKKPYSKYEFGGDRCSKMVGRCGIREFLQNHRTVLEAIGDYLRKLPVSTSSASSGAKTEELERAQAFIERFLASPDDIEAEDPCLRVGDLLIALESIGCSTIYTLNTKESQHLAKLLNQSLVYRPPNSDNPEIEYLADETWPPM